MDRSKTPGHGIDARRQRQSCARGCESCVPDACDGRHFCGIQDGAYPSKSWRWLAALSPAAAFG
jgi:hypothetical protein